MKRYFVLIGAGFLIGAALRWATSPIAPVAHHNAPDVWTPD